MTDSEEVNNNIETSTVNDEVTLTHQPAPPIINDQDDIDQLSPEHREKLATFYSLCKIAAKDCAESAGPDDKSIISKKAALDAILQILTHANLQLRTCPRFIGMIKILLCNALIKSSLSHVSKIYESALSIFLVLVGAYRAHLRAEIGVFLDQVFIRFLDSSNSSFAHKFCVLEVLHRIVSNPLISLELFINYDCFVDEPDLYHRTISCLASIVHGKYSNLPEHASVTPVNQQVALRALALKALVTMLTELVTMCMKHGVLPNQSINNDHTQLSKEENEQEQHIDTCNAIKNNKHPILDTTRNSLMQPQPPPLKTFITPLDASSSSSQLTLQDETNISLPNGNNINNCNNNKNNNIYNITSSTLNGTEEYSSSVLLPSPSLKPLLPTAHGGSDTPSVAALLTPQQQQQQNASKLGPADISRNRMTKMAFKRGVLAFNLKPKEGLKVWIQEGVLPLSPSPVDIANVLIRTLSTDVDRRVLGDYLSGESPEEQATLMAFIENLDTCGLYLDEAVELVMTACCPGESQKIDRVMEKLGEKFITDNPGVYQSADVAYTLAYAILMLHTACHNPNTPANLKMDAAAFARQVRSVDENVPEAHAIAMHARVSAREWTLPGEEQQKEREQALKGTSGSGVFSKKKFQLFLQETSRIVTAGSTKLMKTKRLNQNYHHHHNINNTNNFSAESNSAAASAQRTPIRQSTEVDEDKILQNNEAPISTSVNENYQQESELFYLVEDPKDHADEIAAMIEMLAWPLLAGFSVVLETCAEDDERLATPSIEGLRLLARLCCYYSFCDERDATLAALVKFTHTVSVSTAAPLSTPLGKKSIAALYALLQLGVDDGNFLGIFAWESILSVVSEVLRLTDLYLQSQLNTTTTSSAAGFSSTGSGVYQMSGNAHEKDVSSGGGTTGNSLSTLFGSWLGGGNNSNLNGRTSGNSSDARGGKKDVVGSQVRKKTQAEITKELARGKILAGEAELPALIDFIYTKSSRLSADTLEIFVKALCNISDVELCQLDQMATSGSVFSLQKLVEVAHFNMGRERIVWTRIWNVIRMQFARAAQHRSKHIAMYSLDGLRQLSIKFLSKGELDGYSFQSQFMQPFESVLESPHCAPEVRDFVVYIMSHIALVETSRLKSGWRTVFAVFKHVGTFYTRIQQQQQNSSISNPNVLLNTSSGNSSLYPPSSSNLLTQHNNNQQSFSDPNMTELALISHAASLLNPIINTLETVIRTSANILITSYFHDLVSSLQCFSSIDHPTIPLKAITLLSMLTDHLSTMCPPIEQQTQTRQSEVQTTDQSDLTTAVSSKVDTSLTRRRIPKLTADAALERWQVILSVLVQIFAEARGGALVRCRSLDLLFDSLTSYGPKLFSPAAWRLAFKGVILPLLDDSCYAAAHLETSLMASAAPAHSANGSRDILMRNATSVQQQLHNKVFSLFSSEKAKIRNKPTSYIPTSATNDTNTEGISSNRHPPVNHSSISTPVSSRQCSKHSLHRGRVKRNMDENETMKKEDGGDSTVNKNVNKRSLSGDDDDDEHVELRVSPGIVLLRVVSLFGTVRNKLLPLLPDMLSLLASAVEGVDDRAAWAGVEALKLLAKLTTRRSVAGSNDCELSESGGGTSPRNEIKMKSALSSCCCSENNECNGQDNNDNSDSQHFAAIQSNADGHNIGIIEDMIDNIEDIPTNTFTADAFTAYNNCAKFNSCPTMIDDFSVNYNEVWRLIALHVAQLFLRTTPVTLCPDAAAAICGLTGDKDLDEDIPFSPPSPSKQSPRRYADPSKFSIFDSALSRIPNVEESMAKILFATEKKSEYLQTQMAITSPEGMLERNSSSNVTQKQQLINSILPTPQATTSSALSFPSPRNNLQPQTTSISSARTLDFDPRHVLTQSATQLLLLSAVEDIFLPPPASSDSPPSSQAPIPWSAAKIILQAISRSAEFAHTFNQQVSRRVQVQESGFLTHVRSLPGLSRQERMAVGCLMEMSLRFAVRQWYTVRSMKCDAEKDEEALLLAEVELEEALLWFKKICYWFSDLFVRKSDRALEYATFVNPTSVGSIHTNGTSSGANQGANRMGGKTMAQHIQIETERDVASLASLSVYPLVPLLNALPSEILEDSSTGLATLILDLCGEMTFIGSRKLRADYRQLLLDKIGPLIRKKSN